MTDLRRLLDGDRLRPRSPSESALVLSGVPEPIRPCQAAEALPAEAER